MKLDLKENNDFLRTLNVLIKWDDIKNDFYKEYQKIKSQYQISGFRKGKVPDNILRKNLGNSIEAQFIDNAVNVYYKNALKELKIVPINQGQITSLDFKEFSDLKFTISFEVKPSFKLPNYQKKVNLKTNQYIANKQDLETTHKDLQAQHAKAKSVDGKLKNGHFIYADFHKLDENGAEVKDSVMKNHYIKIGEGLFVDKLASSFIGKKINDELKISIPQDSGTIDYKVKINKIEEQILPEINDDFAKLVDPHVKNIEELNKKILDNIQMNLNNENKKEFNNQIIDFFLDKSKFKVPDSMTENYKTHLIEQYKQQAAAKNQSFDETQHEEEIKSATLKTVKWHLIREQIILNEKLKVGSKEVEEYIDKMIQDSPQHKKEIKKYYNEQNNKYNLHEEIINKKLFDELEKHFENKKKELSTDKLRKTKRK